jgi:hypothetical protein
MLVRLTLTMSGLLIITSRRLTILMRSLVRNTSGTMIAVYVVMRVVR